MSSAITFLHDEVLHSVLAVPMVDITYTYDFIEHPLLDQNELQIIKNLEDIALKKLDVFLCNRSQRSILVYSAAGLNACRRTADHKVYICNGRVIKQQTYQHNCEKLPKDIFFELSRDLILIKTDNKKLKLECKNHSQDIFLNSSYSIIRARQDCKLIGKDFMIDDYHNDPKIDFQNEPFQVEYFHKEKDHNFSTAINDITDITLNVTKKTNQIKKDFEKLETVHSENIEKSKLLEESMAKHGLLSYSFHGTWLTVFFLICIVLGCYFKKCCCFIPKVLENEQEQDQNND